MKKTNAQVKDTHKCYHVVYRDRSDESPLAVFFMIYSRLDDSVLWESATYYNLREVERSAEKIKTKLDVDL